MPGNLHQGHRGRMREKFNLYGRDVFHSHELLEMLLFHAVAQRNTNPIAKELILRFGSLNGVLSASKEELMSVSGVGPKIADMLIDIGRIDINSLISEHHNSEYKFDDYNILGDFFVSYFEGCLEYKVVMMMLNSKLEYIELAEMYNGDYGMSGVRAEGFLDAAVSARASVVAIAHNHPYGPPFPTPSDIASGNMLYDAFSGVGITVLEDYVVSGKEFVGYMKNLSAAFSHSLYLEKFILSKRGESYEK